MLTLSVDGGPAVPVPDVRVSAADVDRVEVGATQVPDPKWRHVDTAGHTHRWVAPQVEARRVELDPVTARLVQLPRLRNLVINAYRAPRSSVPRYELPTATEGTEHIPCDGTCDDVGCEGYDLPVWHCTECGEQLEPGHRREWGHYLEHVTGWPRIMLATDGSPFPAATILGGMDIPPAVLEDDGHRVAGRVVVLEHEFGRGRDTWRLEFLPDVDAPTAASSPA